MSELCRVCLVFPPPVSIFGLFPVLISCHYELIRFQVKSSQVTFIYIALLTIQIVTKQLHNIKMGK